MSLARASDEAVLATALAEGGLAKDRRALLNVVAGGLIILSAAARLLGWPAVRAVLALSGVQHRA